MTTNIVRAAIHPGLGICRMGNAETYFVGPQVLQPAPKPKGFYHQDGLLKREAAEFRIFGYDIDGNVIAELTSDNADIRWDVHLAARKASWYKFRAAMDLDAAKDFSLQRRNPKYAANRRDDLTIDPGPRAISGANQGGTDQEKFFGSFVYEDTSEDVMIGELRTDASGRLHVLSGFGVSGSPVGLPVYNGSEQDAFGNATGWFDEACDGPVNAMISIKGREIPCDPAWVAAAPPNYAPEIIGWRTLLDLLVELWQEAGWLTHPSNVSFTNDIYPILGRLSGLQWVNQGFAAFFGPDRPLDFSNPELVDKLCRIHGQNDTFAELRRQIFNTFRPISGDGVSLRSQPWIYGDAFGTFPASDPLNGLPLWPAAETKMKRWVDGDFIADWGQIPAQPSKLEEIALADQPDMLDRAPLHFCLADAFHPGTELTWPLRHQSIWEKPFRIKARPAGELEPDFGDHLTTAIALGADGPLHAQVPGGLSRWMALPWQADTAGCRSGYETDFDPDLPTFWPARVPNHVLTEDAYRRVMDSTLSDSDRLDAFYERRSWYYPLNKYGTDDMTLMVRHFAEMGVVERRDGPVNLDGVPPVIFVETLPLLPQGVAMFTAAMLESVPDEAGETAEDFAAQRAGWRNEAQRQFFRKARFSVERQSSDGS